MLAMMTRISPTVSGNYQFKSSAGKSDKFAMWLDTNGNGEFENIERVLNSQSPVSANIQLESGRNYNLMSVYGSPSISQINDFSPNQVPDLKLWLDAEDTTTITTVSDSVEVENWSNKVDPSVKMVSQTYKPDTGSSINGLNAIDFDKINTNQIEYMVAQKGSINWTPATEDGTISGEEAEKVQNLALFMVARVDTVRRSHFPFGFGWYDHFPWENGVVYWKHESKRPTFSIGGSGTTFMLTMLHSRELGRQLAYLNGTKVFDGPRTNDNSLGTIKVFEFPNTNASGNMSSKGYGIDWTLGELMVVRGTPSDANREKNGGLPCS